MLEASIYLSSRAPLHSTFGKVDACKRFHAYSYICIALAYTSDWRVRSRLQPQGFSAHL